VLIHELLAHGIAELKRRQGVTELRNFIVAEPKAKIQAPFELIQILTRQAFGPRQIVLIGSLNVAFKQNLILLLLLRVINIQFCPLFVLVEKPSRIALVVVFKAFNFWA
jgi:hypothetical protein